MDMMEAITACRERLFAVVGRLHRCRQPHDPPSSPGSGRRHHRLALAGLDHDEARAVDGQLEGLTRAAPNEGAHLEAALDLRLQVCRLADHRLRGNEGPLMGAVQKRRRTIRGRGLRLIQWWCLAVECCGRGGDFMTEFRIRYCHGQASSPRTPCERRADPGLGRRG